MIRALHDYVLANESAPLDEDELIKRASALVPASRTTAGTELIVAVAGGPRRAVLRPAELEADDLRRFLMAEALTGDDAVLSTSAGTRVELSGDTLQLVQDNGTGLVSLDEAGSVVVVQPAVDDHRTPMGLPSVVEEDVTERITRAIRFCARVLAHVDGAQRLSHVVPVAALRGAGYLPWRTRAEQQRSPNAATLSTRGVDRIVVELSPPVRRRTALRHNTQQLAEDFTVRLRREVIQ